MPRTKRTRKPLDLMKYAASPSNPPKGYGSIDKGCEVARYRISRLQMYRDQGYSYVDAVTQANKDTVSKFGEPF